MDEVPEELDEYGFTAEEKQSAIENMYVDLDLFSRTCTPGALTSETPAFHKEMDQAYLDRSNDKILIVAPRNHAKSTKAGLAWVLHHILYDEGPKVIALVSRTQKHATRLLGTIKYALDGAESANLKYFFSDHPAIADDLEKNAPKWTESEIKLPDGTLIVALGTGQQIRGTKEGYLRPTLIIVDDPEDEANTKTMDVMDDNFDWLLGGACPALADGGRIIVIGTMIADMCMVDRLKKAKGWCKLWYQAILDEEKKITLWPSRWPYERLMKLKTEAESVGKLALWYKEYMNEIIAPENQPFRAEMWSEKWSGEVKNYKDEKYAELIMEKEGEWWAVPVFLYMGVDPARSKEATADYSAISICGMDKDRHVYSVYQFRDRLYPMELAAKIIEVSNQYALKGINIETVGYQDMLRDYLKEQKLFLPGIERKNQPRTSKSDRIMGMQPRFSQGGITLQDTDGDRTLIEELTKFNPSKRNNRDDMLDALWYSLKDMHPCPIERRRSSDPRPKWGGKSKKRRRLGSKSWMA